MLEIINEYFGFISNNLLKTCNSLNNIAIYLNWKYLVAKRKEHKLKDYFIEDMLFILKSDEKKIGIMKCKQLSKIRMPYLSVLNLNDKRIEY